MREQYVHKPTKLDDEYIQKLEGMMKERQEKEVQIMIIKTPF